jgi:hypothetical protein
LGELIKDKMGGTCSTYGGEGMCIHGFNEKPREKEKKGRFGRTLEYNIKTDVQKNKMGESTGFIWLRLVISGGFL